MDAGGWSGRLLLAGCALAACLLVACGDVTAPLGADCMTDADCTSGMCVFVSGSRVCSEPCTAGETCPGAPEDPLLTCREGDVCGPRCAFSGAQAGFRCDPDGTVRPCASGNDVDDCASCGCSYFGGGRCVAGMGCIDPLPLGASCPEDNACESDLCGAGGLCIEPAGLGAACREDRECVSGHCSTDGNTSRMGTCEIMVGRGCSPGDPYCSLCRTAGQGNLCFRENCNSTNATCPTGWRCLNTDGGGTACFQLCDPDRPFTSCSVSTAQCSSTGVCSRTY